MLPTLCVNQAGVVFANGTGFGTSSTRVGWTIGYGAEFDLGRNWSAKAEYDYLSFGRHTALASDGTTIMSRPVRHQPGQGRLELPLYARNGGRRQVLMPGQPAHPDRPNLEFNWAVASGDRPISFAAGGKSDRAISTRPDKVYRRARRNPASTMSSLSDDQPQAI